MAASQNDRSGDVRPPARRRLSLDDVDDAFMLGGVQLDTPTGQEQFGAFLRQGIEAQANRAKMRGRRATIIAGLGGAALTGAGAVIVEYAKLWLKLSP